MAKSKLSVKQKLGFGIFDLGGNMMFTLMSFWALKYLTDTVGIAAAWAGAAVMIGKAWDAVTDPVMGYISDRTVSPWGRRRVYLLFGAVPVLLSMVFFFTSPVYLPSSWYVPWAIGALVLYSTASTVINVPYTSLTPELSDEYHEQSSLNAYRFGCAVFGTIAGAAAVQPLVQAFASEGSLNPMLDRRGFSMMGLILGIVVALSTILTFLGTKEKKRVKADLPKEGFFTAYLSVFKNKPFVVLFLTYGLHLTGISFLTTILPYYTENVLKRPDITTFSMVILLVTAMLFIPVSVFTAKKIGKRRTYQICFALISLACLAISALGHKMGVEFFYAVLFVAGVGVGFSYVAPFAMVPDAIASEETGGAPRHEGSYYGMWTFVSKLGAALAIFIAGNILGLGGYVSQGGETVFQPSSVITAIRLIIGPIPALVLIGAIILMQFYSIDDKLFSAAKKASREP